MRGALFVAGVVAVAVLVDVATGRSAPGTALPEPVRRVLEGVRAFGAARGWGTPPTFEGGGTATGTAPPATAGSFLGTWYAAGTKS